MNDHLVVRPIDISKPWYITIHKMMKFHKIDQAHLGAFQGLRRHSAARLHLPYSRTLLPPGYRRHFPED